MEEEEGGREGREGESLEYSTGIGWAWLSWQGCLVPTGWSWCIVLWEDVRIPTDISPLVTSHRLWAELGLTVPAHSCSNKGLQSQQEGCAMRVCILRARHFCTSVKSSRPPRCSRKTPTTHLLAQLESCVPRMLCSKVWARSADSQPLGVPVASQLRPRNSL